MKGALVCMVILLSACGRVAMSCPASEAACGGDCIDVASDIRNCGACGHTCAADEVCGRGVCAACPSNQLACGGACTDVATDVDNCGGCGTACDGGQVCVAGQCQAPCDTARLMSPIRDPWGATWDGLERAPAALDVAQVTCQGFGARLPTASELFRVSAPQSGVVGQSFHTNYLWSLAPDDHLNQAVLRLSDGGTSTLAAATAGAYRCVCAGPAPRTFTGTRCNGSPGSECFSFGRYNVDAKDRPALRKSAAVWECTNEHAHIADLPQLAEAIRSGLPGSGQLVATADAAIYYGSSQLRWTTGSWTMTGNTGVVDLRTPAPFRCAGPRDAVSPNPNAIPGGFVGPLSPYKGETTDTPAMPWAAALAACTARGGHLPRATEAAELIQQGLPNGSNTYLWSADEVGYNGTQFLVAINVWTALDQRYGYSYTADAATTTSWAYKTDSHPFRCIYYPLDPTASAPTTCVGGCYTAALAGAPASTMWFDSADRMPATLTDAFAACAAEHGHLASERDYAEAIQLGLPNGSDMWLWTSDLGLGNNPTLAVMVVQWTGANDRTFVDQWPNDKTWDGSLESLRPYRCMWTNELR